MSPKTNDFANRNPPRKWNIMEPRNLFYKERNGDSHRLANPGVKIDTAIKVHSWNCENRKLWINAEVWTWIYKKYEINKLSQKIKYKISNVNHLFLRWCRERARRPLPTARNFAGRCTKFVINRVLQTPVVQMACSTLSERPAWSALHSSQVSKLCTNQLHYIFDKILI